MSDQEEIENEGREDESTHALVSEPWVQGARQALDRIRVAMQKRGRLESPLQELPFGALKGNLATLGRITSEANDRLARIVGSEAVRSVNRALEQYRSSLVSIGPIDIAPLQEVSRGIRAFLTRYSEIQAELAASYLLPLQQALPRIALNFQPILDAFKRAQARQLEHTLRRNHWWPVPGLPIDFYEGVLDLVEQGQTRRVNRYICSWFGWNRHRRLGRMARRWDSDLSFRRRRPIYNQALAAHRRGWYNLTVPALIPLVEGVARDYLRVKHGITERSGRRAIEEALGRNIPSDVFREELQQAVVRFLTSSTFADTDSGDVLPSGYELNRHGVAHSRHLRYGTEANSLRCLLLLETLYQFIADSPPPVSWW